MLSSNNEIEIYMRGKPRHIYKALSRALRLDLVTHVALFISAPVESVKEDVKHVLVRLTKLRRLILVFTLERQCYYEVRLRALIKCMSPLVGKSVDIQFLGRPEIGDERFYGNSIIPSAKLLAVFNKMRISSERKLDADKKMRSGNKAEGEEQAKAGQGPC